MGGGLIGLLLLVIVAGGYWMTVMTTTVLEEYNASILQRMRNRWSLSKRKHSKKNIIILTQRIVNQKKNVCWSIAIIYEFLILCDFVYTLCVVCLPLWYTNNMYTLLLSYVFTHTVPLSLSLFIPHCFRSRYIIESIRSFIHSFDGEGVIFIRFMCCYGLFVSWKVSICHRERWSESEWDQVVFAYVLAIGGVPWLSLSPCRAVFSWSVLGILLQRIQYISVLLLFDFVGWRLVVRECVGRRERISIDLFVFFWSLVGWECRMTACCECAPNQFALSLSLSRGTVSVYSFAHFFSLFYSFAFHVFDGWRVECRLSPWMSLLIFRFY